MSRTSTSTHIPPSGSEDIFLCPIQSLPNSEKRRLANTNSYIKRLLVLQRRNKDIIKIDDVESSDDDPSAVQYLGAQRPLESQAFAIGQLPLRKRKPSLNSSKQYNTSEEYKNSLYSSKLSSKHHHSHRHNHHSSHRHYSSSESESSPSSFSSESDSDRVHKSSRLTASSTHRHHHRHKSDRSRKSEKHSKSSSDKQSKRARKNQEILSRVLHSSEVAAQINPFEETQYESVVASMFNEYGRSHRSTS